LITCINTFFLIHGVTGDRHIGVNIDTKKNEGRWTEEKCEGQGKWKKAWRSAVVMNLEENIYLYNYSF